MAEVMFEVITFGLKRIVILVLDLPSRASPPRSAEPDAWRRNPVLRRQRLPRQGTTRVAQDDHAEGQRLHQQTRLPERSAGPTGRAPQVIRLAPTANATNPFFVYTWCTAVFLSYLTKRNKWVQIVSCSGLPSRSSNAQLYGVYGAAYV